MGFYRGTKDFKSGNILENNRKSFLGTCTFSGKMNFDFFSLLHLVNTQSLMHIFWIEKYGEKAGAEKAMLASGCLLFRSSSFSVLDLSGLV